MIVVLSDEQLERIEDALTTADSEFGAHREPEDAIRRELRDALKIVKAARALLAA